MNDRKQDDDGQVALLLSHLHFTFRLAFFAPSALRWRPAGDNENY